MPASVPDVALYVPSLRGGGAERVMVLLANGLSEQGLKVDLVLVEAHGPYLQDVVNDVRIVDLNASRVSLSLPSLVRYLRRDRPRAVLSALNHANVTVLLAKRLSRSAARVIVTEHNTLTTSLRGDVPVRARLAPRLMRWTYPWANAVAAVSQGVADDLAAVIDYPRQNIHVLYNPVVSDSIRELADGPVSHPWLSSGQPPVIIGVGRLTQQKDFSTLLQAFARVRAERRAKLLILGEGELRTELEALAQRLGIAADVALPGFVQNPYAWMRRSSVFVLSSAWEGLPTVLIEAMACGTPVVSTNCPSGPSEILENGKWGRLVPVGDSAAMADAIGATLAGGDGMNAFFRAQDFHTEAAVQRYLDVLRLNS